MNGSTMERELMAVLRGHGFVPIRAPASGTGDWDLPDVLAARDGVVVAIELKSGANPRNVENSEVEALRRVGGAFWAASLIAVRYKGDRTFYLSLPESMSRTDSGNYSIPNGAARLPWAVSLPYKVDADHGVIPRHDTGDDGVVHAGMRDGPPTLSDWLDAVTAKQQGFDVRRGVIDGPMPGADADPDADPDADARDGDADD